MSKRFIETELWKKGWFLELMPEEKAAWFYLLTNCDAVGVIETAERLANFMVGTNINWKELVKKSNDHIIILDNGNLFIKKYCHVQYGESIKDLDSKSPPIKSHQKLLKSHGLLEIVCSNYDKLKIGKTHNISQKTRVFVIQRDGKECVYCGKKVNNFELALDHVVPRTKGGEDSSDNLVVCCRSCNSKKSDLDLMDFIEKYSGNCIETVTKRVAERVSVTLKEKEEEKAKFKVKEKKEVKAEKKEKEPENKIELFKQLWKTSFPDQKFNEINFINMMHKDGRIIKLESHTTDEVDQAVRNFAICVNDDKYETNFKQPHYFIEKMDKYIDDSMPFATYDFGDKKDKGMKERTIDFSDMEEA